MDDFFCSPSPVKRGSTAIQTSSFFCLFDGNKMASDALGYKIALFTHELVQPPPRVLVAMRVKWPRHVSDSVRIPGTCVRRRGHPTFPHARAVAKHKAAYLFPSLNNTLFYLPDCRVKAHLLCSFVSVTGDVLFITLVWHAAAFHRDPDS